MSSIRSAGLADQERLEVLLHRRLHQVGALREGGAAVAVQAVLVGGDLDHRRAATPAGCVAITLTSLIFGDGMPRVARSAFSWATAIRAGMAGARAIIERRFLRRNAHTPDPDYRRPVWLLVYVRARKNAIPDGVGA